MRGKVFGLAVAGSAAGLWATAAVKSGTIWWRQSGPAVRPEREPMEAFSRGKRYVAVNGQQIAYIDEGAGDPILLLHGCPFHAYEWRDVIPLLSQRFRVLAPDLLGLGDTVVTLQDDYRLPRDAEMVQGFLDALGIESAHVVGHDHGGATALLLMKRAPQRMRSLVLTNIEAYDAWPSAEERKYLSLVVHPLTSPLFWALLHLPAVRREVFSIAAHRREVLTEEVLDAFIRAHLSTPARWQRLRRFFGWQVDRDHNLETLRAVDAMRAFTTPTLILWGRRDGNFGESIARRLSEDIPGVAGIEWLEDSGHLPMLEEPEAYAAAVVRFISRSASEDAPARATQGLHHGSGGGS